MTLPIIRRTPFTGDPEPAEEAETIPTAAGPQEATGLTITEARELLDWLEAHGITAQSVDTDPDGRFTVRWTN